jgi:thymidylate kinase
MPVALTHPDDAPPHLRARPALTLVLIGPHTSGKSTLAALLAQRHGWRCDVHCPQAPLHYCARATPSSTHAAPRQEELGEALRRQDPHARVDCRAPQVAFDAAMLRAEAARDSIGEAPALQRVVETWHPGNLGWAEARATDAAALSALRRATAAAVARHAGAPGAPLVLVQPLLTSATAVALRRAAGAASRVRACASAAGDDAEAALVAHTARVAQLATQHAAALGLRMLPPVRTDDGRDANAAADAVYASVLAAAAPQPPRLVPNLFTSLADAAAQLRAASGLDARLRTPEADALLQELAALQAPAHAAAQAPLAGGRAVVVEGLDGTGKTTLVAALAAALGAHTARTPPASLAHLRPLFDAQPPAVARAFYTAGNYVAAQQVARDAADGRPTVVRLRGTACAGAAHAASSRPARCAAQVDRFYHSTAAYTLGAACADPAALAALPAAAFAWPADLPAPALVIVLRMDDAERFRRLRARGAPGWGPTEAAQQADGSLAARIADAYARVAPPRGTRVVQLDAAASPEALCAAALAACAHAGL